METMPYCYYCALVLLLLLVLFLASKRYLHSDHTKQRPSVPLAFPIIGHLHLLKQPIHRTLAAISERYGPVLLLRFGSRRVLHVSSASGLEECFTKNDVAFADRALFLFGDYAGYRHTAVAVAPYGPRVRSVRRLISLHANPSSFPATSSLIRRLYSSASKDAFRKVDLRSRLNELTMDVIMTIIAGKKCHRDEETEERRRFCRVIEELFSLSGVASAEDFVPAARWVALTGVERKLERLGKEMDELYQDLVEERRAMGKWKKTDGDEGEDEEEKTLIDIMLAMQEKEPHEYTDEVIKGTIGSLIAAGTETSLVTMEWAMALLLNHPEAMAKAKAEIHQHVGRDRLLTESDFPNLGYLHNVLKETLRLFPPAPLLLPHQSSQHCTVSDLDVPKGAMLLANVFAIHRDPQLWVDPLEFKPERFEAKDVGKGFKYVPFGAGRRRCPGESMAWREMVMSLGSLIQCFHWERVGDELIDLTEGVALSMSMARPLEAVYKPRSDMLHLLSQL